jgi:hypothetical protein
MQKKKKKKKKKQKVQTALIKQITLMQEVDLIKIKGQKE